MLRIAAIMLALILWTAPAWALYGDSEGALGVDGSLRAIVLGINNYDNPDIFGDHGHDWLAQLIGRLTAEGHPRENFAYEAHLVQVATFATAPGGGLGASALGRADQRYRVLDLEFEWHDQTYSNAVMFLDRLNAKLSFSWGDLTLGRQAVTFGKAYFWNPLDEFLPFDPSQFDRDYKPGVDAARLDIPLGDFSGLNLVAVGGRTLDAQNSYLNPDAFGNLSWQGSALLARGFTTLKGFDLALQGGKIYGGYELGGALSGDAGPVQVRAEAAYKWAVDSEPLSGGLEGDLMENHLTAVVGAGRRFEFGLEVESELLYNGGGESNDLRSALARQSYGSIPHMSRWVWGLRLSYEILPVLNAYWAFMLSMDDLSWQTQPSLVWSLSDNTELLGGLTINRGERPGVDDSGNTVPKSEFGLAPDYFFLEFKWYF